MRSRAPVCPAHRSAGAVPTGAITGRDRADTAIGTGDRCAYSRWPVSLIAQTITAPSASTVNPDSDAVSTRIR